MNRRTMLLITNLTCLLFTTSAFAATATNFQLHSHLNKPYSRIADEDAIKTADKYKMIAIDLMANNDYYNAKYYLHQAIEVLKNTDGSCIDVKRVFELKKLCQKNQSFMNHADWGYVHSKHQAAEIWPALAEQLRYFKVSGYENITAKQLLKLISQASQRIMLKQEVYFSIWDKIFNEDGIDYAIVDHMGLYHASVINYIEMFAIAAHVLNVNIAIISQDTSMPIIIKQNNAVATLYVGLYLQFDNIEKAGPVRVDSAYVDENSKPNKSLQELIDNTTYSYE